MLAILPLLYHQQNIESRRQLQNAEWAARPDPVPAARKRYRLQSRLGREQLGWGGLGQERGGVVAWVGVGQSKDEVG